MKTPENRDAAFREQMIALTMQRRGCDRAEAEVIVDRVADRLGGATHDEAAAVNPLPCNCPGPMVNVNVDGNRGHSPGCPANPLTGPHPEYLDDDGFEGVQFVRHDLAATDGEVMQYVKREGLWWMDDMQVDVVWMLPTDEPGRPEGWYAIVPSEAEGVVRYWRLRP